MAMMVVSRYELRATMTADGRERLLGWEMTQEAAELMAALAVTSGQWRDAVISDRGEQPELTYRRHVER